MTYLIDFNKLMFSQSAKKLYNEIKTTNLDIIMSRKQAGLMRLLLLMQAQLGPDITWNPQPRVIKKIKNDDTLEHKGDVFLYIKIMIIK